MTDEPEEIFIHGFSDQTGEYINVELVPQPVWKVAEVVEMLADRVEAEVRRRLAENPPSGY